MIELNNDSMFVGHIKQILHNFNLPLCQIGDNIPRPNRHFLKDAGIWKWDDSIPPKASYCGSYVYGDEYLNTTGKFEIRNLIYDRRTHRYLGKYLRFLRDYSHLNLMSMYNCFDQEINFDEVSFKYTENDVEKQIVFDTVKNSNLVCYKVPVSFENLTISTHSNTEIEICVTSENKKSTSKKLLSKLAQLTYKKIKFNDILNYNMKDILIKIMQDDATKIDNNYNMYKFISGNLDSLELLIKVPITLDTSIVVLEGTYINNQELSQEDKQYFAYLNNEGEIKYDDKNSYYTYYCNYTDEKTQEKIKGVKESGFNINCQLLSSENAKGNFLLADKLVEYLSGNVITNLSEPYEIERIQRVLDSIRYSNAKEDEELAKKLKSNYIKDRHYGIWNESDFRNLKTLISYYHLDGNFDSIGYLDKDLESIIRGKIDDVKFN